MVLATSNKKELSPSYIAGVSPVHQWERGAIWAAFRTFRDECGLSAAVVLGFRLPSSRRVIALYAALDGALSPDGVVHA